MKHTLGPWKVKIHKAHKTNKPQYEIESRTSLPICIVCDISKQPVEANANLIAAAPELLEALERIVKGYDAGGKLTRETLQVIAKRAIAKAKGNE